VSSFKIFKTNFKNFRACEQTSVFSQKEEDNCDELLKLTKINLGSEYTEFIDNTHVTLLRHYDEVLSWLKEPKVRILIFKNLQKVESFSLISSGKNATTYKVTFEEDIHAVLKVPNSSTDDNLYYEFRVGQNVNRFATVYPCFIQTYALFESKKTNLNLNLQNIQNMTIIPDTQQLIGPNCKNSDKIALMIENIENPMTIANFYKEGKDLYDLYGILFQVYFPLFQLQDNFTHNDLNLDNVMLYKPLRDNRYVQMNYHIGEKKISFKSQYIVKIIDYSRCFIKNFSKKFLQDVCNDIKRYTILHYNIQNRIRGNSIPQLSVLSVITLLKWEYVTLTLASVFVSSNDRQFKSRSIW
jgi:hypothetical protein